MAATGVWVAFNRQGVDQLSASIATGAEAALWEAVDREQGVVFWAFGQTLQEAIAAGVTKRAKRSPDVHLNAKNPAKADKSPTVAS